MSDEAKSTFYRPTNQKVVFERNVTFIVIEGPRGVGKSTLVKGVREKLTSLGVNSVWTREPSAVRYGKDAIARTRDGINDILTLLLFCADRAAHFDLFYDEGEPFFFMSHMPDTRIKADAIVICDRYSLSTWVYQGRDEATRNLIEEIHKKLIEPDKMYVVGTDRERWLEVIRGDTSNESDRAGLRKSDMHPGKFESFMDLYLEGATRIPAKSVEMLHAYGPIDEMVNKVVQDALDIRRRKVEQDKSFFLGDPDRQQA